MTKTDQSKTKHLKLVHSANRKSSHTCKSGPYLLHKLFIGGRRVAVSQVVNEGGEAIIAEGNGQHVWQRPKGAVDVEGGSRALLPHSNGLPSRTWVIRDADSLR